MGRCKNCYNKRFYRFMKYDIIEILKKTIKHLDFPIVEPTIQKPKHEKDVDFATNIAFIISKQLNSNPIKIAEKIKKNIIDEEIFDSVEIAGPGFINFKINQSLVIN